MLTELLGYQVIQWIKTHTTCNESIC